MTVPHVLYPLKVLLNLVVSLAFDHLLYRINFIMGDHPSSYPRKVDTFSIMYLTNSPLDEVPLSKIYFRIVNELVVS